MSKDERSSVPSAAPVNTEQDTYLGALITAYGDACYDQGAWPGMVVEDYEKLGDEVYEAKRKLLAEIARVRSSAPSSARRTDDDYITGQGAIVQSVPPAARVASDAIPQDIQEWLWHLDTHLTEHDVRHAGLALRAAYPAVRDYFTSLRTELLQLRNRLRHAKAALYAELQDETAADSGTTKDYENRAVRRCIARLESCVVIPCPIGLGK